MIIPRGTLTRVGNLRIGDHFIISNRIYHGKDIDTIVEAVEARATRLRFKIAVTIVNQYEVIIKRVG